MLRGWRSSSSGTRDPLLAQKVVAAATVFDDEAAANVIASLVDTYGPEATPLIEAIVQSRVPGYWPHRHRRYFVRRLEMVFGRNGEQRERAAKAMLQRIAAHVRAEEVEIA